MAGKQVAGAGLPDNLAGMTKSQLYDIMSQMKALIEQNQQQARQILIQNPLLTKALFQAQIMLGMVQPPQVIPSIQPSGSQYPQQPSHAGQQSNIQAARLSTGQAILHDQTAVSQMQTAARKHPNQPAVSISSSVPAINVPPQPVASLPLPTPQQTKGYQIPQPVSLSQPSQLPTIAPIPLHSSAQPPLLHQPQVPTASSQLQQPLQSGGNPQLPLQPPFQSQPRALSVSNFHNQYSSQIGSNVGYQPAGASQHVSQSIYHSGGKLPASVGPSFPQLQPSIPSQLPPQSLYQTGSSTLGTELSNQAGNSMQIDRGSSWMPGVQENSAAQLSGLPSSAPSQMGSSNQPSGPPPLTPEMEKMLLQQVMSLTPEQVNLLPPEQRNQVLQLQQILRQ